MIEQNDVQQAVVQAPGWNVLCPRTLLTITPQATLRQRMEETIKIVLTYQRIISVLYLLKLNNFPAKPEQKPRQQFVNADQQNVLLDFSIRRI